MSRWDALALRNLVKADWAKPWGAAPWIKLDADMMSRTRRRPAHLLLGQRRVGLRQPPARRGQSNHQLLQLIGTRADLAPILTLR